MWQIDEDSVKPNHLATVEPYYNILHTTHYILKDRKLIPPTLAARRGIDSPIADVISDQRLCAVQ
jgi:hypothetical protein